MRLLPHQIPPEPAVRDVFALLAHHLDPGEIADVIDQLPAEIKEPVARNGADLPCARRWLI